MACDTEVQYAPISQNKGLTTTTFAGIFGTSGTNFNALFKPGATGGAATTLIAATKPASVQHDPQLRPNVGFCLISRFQAWTLENVDLESGTDRNSRGGYAIAYDREG